MQTKQTKLSEIKPNPNNPRVIKDHKFAQLVKSIQDFPEMLQIRPIVVNAEMVVLGGNMRLKACKEAGLKEVPVIFADSLTEEQQKEFIIKDNVGFGEWDWDQLANEWDAEELSEWGLDVPVFDTENETDYSEKNKEFDANDFEDQKYTIKLEFTEEDYNLVKEKIKELGQSPEKILYDALVSL
jgi:ParB-like chromosome segregation protein Spo0J